MELGPNTTGTSDGCARYIHPMLTLKILTAVQDQFVALLVDEIMSDSSTKTWFVPDGIEREVGYSQECELRARDADEQEHSGLQFM